MLLACRSLCKLLLLRFRVCKNLCKDPQAPWAACIEPSRFHSGSVRSPRFQCLAYKLRKILMSWFAIRVACQSGSDAAACLHERSWRQPDGSLLVAVVFHRTVTPAGWPRRPNGHGFRPRLLRSHLPNARRSPRWTTVPLTRLRRLQLTPSPPKRLHLRRGDGSRLWRQLTPSPPKRLHAALWATVNCRQRQCLGQTALPCFPCHGHDLLGKTGCRHCRGTCEEAARTGKMM